MREVYVAGIGITSFTRLEYPLVEIAAYPGLMALRDSGLKRVDHLFVANMGAGRINGQAGLASGPARHSLRRPRPAMQRTQQ